WSKSYELTDEIGGIEKYMLQFTDDTVSMNNSFVRVPLDTLWSEDSLTANTIYFWRIGAKSNLGWGSKSSWWKFSTAPTGISKINNNIPDKFNLCSNYPNPFNPTTSLKFDIPKNCFVALKIFDINGRQLDILLNSKMDAGSYIINYNAGYLPSGVYFYQLKADNYINTKKMILIK
ncbi:MAG: T9SS type A sorting domain-containing protein, partial [Ignavibacteria bacterium]